MTRKPPTTPEDHAAPTVTPPATVAGGLPALIASARHALSEAGVVRATSALLRVNQDGGFDCPSCAWPEPHERSTFEFCENGAKAVTDEATRARADREVFASYSIAELAAMPDVELNRLGRLTEPMIVEPGATHYTPISWDDALTRIGEHLRALPRPDDAAFYTSGRASNEAAFLWQFFVRAYGTNNLPDCSNMCHESSGTALGETIGIGKGTVQLEDFAKADLIVVAGQNPGTNHPRMLTTLREARVRGARVIGVNPLREAGLVKFQHPQRPLDVMNGGVLLCDPILQVKVGGDLALWKGVAKALLEAERAQPGTVFDEAFLRDHTTGVEALLVDLAEESWARIVDESGLPEAEVRTFADAIRTSQATIVCWAMGLTQHPHAVATIQSIVNVLLLRGMIGKPGAGVCPVRGHSNVQGDRTMGVWEKVPTWIEALERRTGIRAPRSHGLDTVGTIEAMAAGQVRVFLALGGNFLSASPDTELTAAALRRCDLTVHIATKPNRSHLVHGKTGILLPCLGRTEADVSTRGPQEVTVEDSMGVVHRSRGTLTPASPALRSEPAIVCGIALATLGGKVRVPWGELSKDYRKIRVLISQVVPGFEDYEERLQAPGGFVLENAARDRRWKTAEGLARLTVHAIPPRTLPAGQLWLMTVRSHDQFNTTIYDVDDRYRGIYGHRRVILIHPDELASRGLVSGQAVTVTSHFRGETRTAPGFVVLPYDAPRGAAVAYFPEANVLVPIGSVADKSRTPTSKSIAITIEPGPASAPAA